jgi:hypothetical protein
MSCQCHSDACLMSCLSSEEACFMSSPSTQDAWLFCKCHPRTNCESMFIQMFTLKLHSYIHQCWVLKLHVNSFRCEVIHFTLNSIFLSFLFLYLFFLNTGQKSKPKSAVYWNFQPRCTLLSARRDHTNDEFIINSLQLS